MGILGLWQAPAESLALLDLLSAEGRQFPGSVLASVARRGCRVEFRVLDQHLVAVVRADRAGQDEDYRNPATGLAYLAH